MLKDLGLLSAVINTGTAEWGLENVIRSNPVSLISKPRTPRPRDRRLEAGELERLLSAGTSPNPWFRPVVLFAIETGMRRGEILSLCWEHVHLDKRYVHLPDTKNGDSRDVRFHLRRWSCWEDCRGISGVIRRSSPCTLRR